MRIAGVDPGTVETGVGIIDSDGKKTALVFAGTIHSPREKLLSVRLERIFTELKSVFEAWKPDVVALETVFYQKNFATAVKVGEARAVAMLAASLNKIPVAEYPPARIKESVCGNGRAQKDQVQYMVRHILNIKGPMTADAADAIAAALCHLHCEKFEKLKLEASHV